MSFKHGKDVVVKLDDTDLSEYCNNTERSREADSHDVTTYGRTAKRYKGGLKDGTATISGFYDSSEDNGPRAVVDPLVGENVEFVYMPEGEGDGLPQDVVEVLVLNYEETAAVADMITWTAELQFSEDVDSTPQSTS